MKLWLLVGLFSVATIACAAASESATECGLDTRRVTQEETALVASPQAETQIAREVRKERRAFRNSAEANVAQAPAPRTDRRRSGSQRRVPDAMLIDGRGAL